VPSGGRKARVPAPHGPEGRTPLDLTHAEACVQLGRIGARRVELGASGVSQIRGKYLSKENISQKKDSRRKAKLPDSDAHNTNHPSLFANRISLCITSIQCARCRPLIPRLKPHPPILGATESRCRQAGSKIGFIPPVSRIDLLVGVLRAPPFIDGKSKQQKFPIIIYIFLK